HPAARARTGPAAGLTAHTTRTPDACGLRSACAGTPAPFRAAPWTGRPAAIPGVRSRATRPTAVHVLWMHQRTALVGGRTAIAAFRSHRCAAADRERACRRRVRPDPAGPNPSGPNPPAPIPNHGPYRIGRN